jgi:hypothetical protein
MTTMTTNGFSDVRKQQVSDDNMPSRLDRIIFQHFSLSLSITLSVCLLACLSVHADARWKASLELDRLMRSCRDNVTGELFACKTIRKNRVKDHQVPRNEIDLPAQVSDPHIAKFLDAVT